MLSLRPRRGSRAALPVGDLRARRPAPLALEGPGPGARASRGTCRRDERWIFFRRQCIDVAVRVSQWPARAPPRALPAGSAGPDSGPESGARQWPRPPAAHWQRSQCDSADVTPGTSGSTGSQPGPQAPVSPAGAQAGKAASEVHWEPDGRGDLSQTT